MLLVSPFRSFKCRHFTTEEEALKGAEAKQRSLGLLCQMVLIWSYISLAPT